MVVNTAGEACIAIHLIWWIVSDGAILLRPKTQNMLSAYLLAYENFPDRSGGAFFVDKVV